LSRNEFFIGRTSWDRAQLRMANPTAVYHHCDEVLRPAFFLHKRSPTDVAERSIFVSNGAYPLKGVHVVLKAAALLRREFPDLSVRVADAKLRTSIHRLGYEKLLLNIIRANNLDRHVEMVGLLAEDDMAREYARAAVYVNASFVENSSNSIAEAMAIGTPVVASFVGGTRDFVRDGATGLSFPPGDAVALAECIRTVFLDQHLATRLARQAQVEARRRHDPVVVVEQTVNAYRRVLSQESSPRVRDVVSPSHVEEMDKHGRGAVATQ
jgi:glycosyltransferase involved in cell wall biosynthesis